MYATENTSRKKKLCGNLGRATKTEGTTGAKALMPCAERARRIGPEARKGPPSGQWLAFDSDWVRQDLRAQGLKAEEGRSQSLVKTSCTTGLFRTLRCCSCLVPPQVTCKAFYFPLPRPLLTLYLLGVIEYPLKKYLTNQSVPG